MYSKEEIKINRQFAEVSDMAIDMAQDRRILLDFLYTVAAAKNKNGGYTHDREELQQKAVKILDDMDL